MTFSSSMTFTPDFRRKGRGRAALAALALIALAPPLLAAQENASVALEQGQKALLRGDGVAAEVALRRAFEAGAPQAQVAPLMGEAYLQQDDFANARRWLADGDFAPGQRRHGFHMLARLEMAEGNLDAAAAAFARALEGNPGTAEIWVDLGRLRYRMGQHHQALAAAEEALRRDRKDPRALEFRGQIARDAEGLLAALPWLEKGLKSAPDDLSLLGEYAATLGEAGRAKEMLRITRRMIELDAENPRAFYLQAVLAARAGDYTLARRLLARTQDRFDEVPAAMMLEGALEMRAENWALAVDVLDRLARLQPDNQHAALLLARAMLENGDASEVIARYGAAASRADASPYLLVLVGRAYEVLGDRAAAAPLLDRAAGPVPAAIVPLGLGEAGELALFRWGDDPDRLDGAVPRVRQLLADGNLDEAQAYVTRLGARFAGSVDIEVLAGDVALAQRDAARALALYSKAAQVRRSLSLTARMIAALRMLGREGEGRALLAAFLAQHPQNGDAAAMLGYMAADAGDWNRAEGLLRFARQQHDGGGRDPVLFAILADAAMQRGAKAEALADAGAGFASQRTNYRAVLTLARVLDSAGRKDAAMALLEKARKLPGG
ncbi:tetratricopeptide repeat protein [Altererythrobacter sp. CC-YST694]|uniref:tetratricopeptide repeat protein n=1 Tax=Altererythrobacter sp. CC-YST694 TaxID=2755038 RepID=UPI001D029746|nr:tetratricopeptide repeat protein [Altererythrobacter sp. CC-YST694]MCB5424353.1 tetratricopeptide repeat protein [Altererythrobacter sp. CC-YST694]